MSAHNPDPDRLLRPREAARLAGASPESLAAWCEAADAAGRGPWSGVVARTPGGHRRYRRARLLAAAGLHEAGAPVVDSPQKTG